MADESAKGILGHLPPLPRAALNNSVIAMEQAYRQRKGLPLLTDADIEALKAGHPMLWENGDAASADSTPTPAPAATAAAPASSVPAVATSAPSAGISEEVAKWVPAGKKWSKSTIAAEQSRRGRKALPALNDAAIVALFGEPVPAAAAAAVNASEATSVSRNGASTKYVGTPAVGTSRAAAAGGVASIGPEDSEINQQRRRLVWCTVAAFLAAWFFAFFRFFLPRTLFEPATTFKIGYPEEYGLGVDTKFQQRYRIWVDRTPDRIFVIYARCTHLGCTPDWKPSENKFKCPCHGSGYDSEGVNFEGPAPRPMDRAHIERFPDGQILVDVSRLYQWPKGQPSQFNDDGAYLSA